MSNHTITATIVPNTRATAGAATMRTVRSCTCGAVVRKSYTTDATGEVDGIVFRCDNGHGE